MNPYRVVLTFLRLWPAWTVALVVGAILWFQGGWTGVLIGFGSLGLLCLFIICCHALDEWLDDRADAWDRAGRERRESPRPSQVNITEK